MFQLRKRVHTSLKVLKQHAMSRLVIYSKTGRGTKSHIAIQAKVACSLIFSSIGTNFAPPFHSSPFVSGRKILRKVPFNQPCNHRLSRRPPTLIRKLFKQHFPWCCDSCSRIKALKTALSRRSNKILIHHFFPDTGMV